MPQGVASPAIGLMLQCTITGGDVLLRRGQEAELMKRTNDMSTFEQMGEAQLLALEGQRQIAAALVTLTKRALLGVVELVTRSAPSSFIP